MFTSPRGTDERASLILVVLAAVSATGAAVLGVDDNPPGLALAVLAGVMLATAFVHRWRSPKRFLAFSAAAFGASVVAVGMLIAVDISLTGGRVPQRIAPAVDAGGTALALAVAFLVAPSILVGLAGALITWLARRRR